MDNQDFMQNRRENVKKRKLLITASTFPRWENDTEPRFILDYAKEMLKYYDVTVLVPASPGAKQKEVLEGVSVERFHYFPIHKFETLCYPGAIVPRIKEKKIRMFLVLPLFLALYFRVKKDIGRYDIVHAHWLIPQGIIQSFIKNKPYLVTGHGGDVTSLNLGVLKSLKRKCLKDAKAVTVVSSELKARVEELCPNDRTEVIPMGCDIELFSADKRIDNFFKQGDKKVVLFVGRLAEKKGVTYLVEAMKQVQGAVLVIVGKGDREEELRRQAKGLEDKISFIGPRTHEELSVIYASADILVAPSITAKDGDKEGFPLTIIEAMASGLPVIASRTGGVTDGLTDEVNGLLVEEKDVDQIARLINRLIQDGELRKTLAQNAYETAQKYSYKNIASRYFELIENKLGGQTE